MNSTVGSPNPARASSRDNTPEAHKDNATSTATTATGTLSTTNSTTAAPSTTYVIVLSSIYGCTGAPGPQGIPSRYHATKNSVHAIDRKITYGSISETTVPIPACRL